MQYKTSTLIVSSLILGFIALFFSLPASAGSDNLYLDNHFGFYCEQVASSTYLSGGRYLLNGACTSHYLGTALPDIGGSNYYYVAIWQKTSATTATLINGHQIGYHSGTFDSTQPSDSFSVGTTSKVLMATISNTSQSCNYFTNYITNNSYIGFNSSACNWGTLMWTDLPLWTGEWNFMPPPATASTTNADFGIFGNYIRDVLLWLFKPSTASVEIFSGLKTTLETKAPFAYFVSVKNSLSGFSTTTAPNFVLASSTGITNSIFTPLKTGLTWLLWIIFGFWLIRKISNFNF